MVHDLTPNVVTLSHHSQFTVKSHALGEQRKIHTRTQECADQKQPARQVEGDGFDIFYKFLILNSKFLSLNLKIQNLETAATASGPPGRRRRIWKFF